MYGLKAAGYADLLAAQAESPAAYSVPEAWAVPAPVAGILDGQDLRTAFEILTQGRRTKGVMMARSSSMEERPGANPTLMKKYDPKDLRGSFQQFLSAIFKVRNTAPHMGVLATMAVGGIRTFGPSDERFGWENVSFIADSHHPLNPDEMFFAFVHGLGTRAVAGGGEVIQVIVDRNTRKITGFINKNRQKITQFGGGVGKVMYTDEYAQRREDYFDFVAGTVQEANLDGSLLNEPHILVWADGKLFGRRDRLPWDSQKTILGMTPFDDSQMVYNLIDILIYLSDIFGPVQIEGAFENCREEKPYLYQLIKVPADEVTAAPLVVENPFLTSSHVIGRGIFEGPLLVYDNEGDYTRDRMFPNETLRKMDARFAGAGYAILAGQQLLGICNATPNARVRLSQSFENPSGHAPTLMRILTRESPEKGYMFAMDVAQNFEKEPDEVVGPVRIYYHARVTSNGKEVAVELL